jgi:thiol-disulfide isomerase/thioredoxin
MKWILSILLLISIGFNVYFFIDNKKYEENKCFGEYMSKAMGSDINKTTFKDGFRQLKDSLKKKAPELLSKKYYYLSTWAAFCAPCIKEMPWLDSLAGTTHKDVAFIFLSGMSESAANSIIARRKYKIQNFIFLNNQDDFISSVCNEKKVKTIVYPVQMIFKNNGDPVYYETGAYESVKEAAEFVEEINKLK